MIEIPGPLHIAFHILQCVYTIFRELLSTFQEVVDWKKIQKNHVSDCYNLSRQLCFLGLDECERYTWDLFILKHSKHITFMKKQISMEKFAIWLATRYKLFITNTLETSTDERMQYMMNFIIFASEFRLYHDAMRSGDRLVQEHIYIKFIGVFMLLNKQVF